VKNTTLSAVAGLESISADESHIDDRLVNDAPENNHDAGMVFQKYALYPPMTAYDNRAFALNLRATPLRESRADSRDFVRMNWSGAL
jgi:ABC-type sugar transport system ATPase subunit